jgi:hypothetical protein
MSQTTQEARNIVVVTGRSNRLDQTLAAVSSLDDVGGDTRLALGAFGQAQFTD